MLQARVAQAEQEAGIGLQDTHSSILKEWLVELSPEEKEVWLWNSLVEIKRIKQRRAV